MAASDREALQTFLVHLFEFVGRALETHRDDLGGEGSEELARLWQNQERRIAAVSQALYSESFDEPLEEVGLTDDELRLKLSIYYGAVNAYEDEATTSGFRDVLEASNITLGSLGLFFPVLHGVEEIKEIIE
jgi:hypothetical protein